MSDKTLLELIEEAEDLILTYRNPDISVHTAAIDRVLVGLGIGIIGRDKVESIYFMDDVVFIETSYTCRGCAQESHFDIPLSIVRSEDPIRAANLYRLEKNLKESESRLEQAKLRVSYCEGEVERFGMALREFCEK